MIALTEWVERESEIWERKINHPATDDFGKFYAEGRRDAVKLLGDDLKSGRIKELKGDSNPFPASSIGSAVFGLAVICALIAAGFFLLRGAA